MVLIVMSHCDDWTGLAQVYKTTSFLNRLITDWLNIGGSIGVGCFLLISGYFMVDKQITFKKILSILGEVWFYTICIWIIFALVMIFSHQATFHLLFKHFCFSFFPFLFSYHWFVTAYVILMALSPLFNKLISKMKKTEYLTLLTVLILFVSASIIPNAFHGVASDALIPVILMYFIAGYIKKYVIVTKINAKKHLCIAVCGYFFLYGTAVGNGILGDILHFEKLIAYRYFFRTLGSPLVMIINVELFLFFLGMTPKSNSKLNAIASSTFGIYLIHGDNIIATYVFPVIFPLSRIENSAKLFICAIGRVATVYIVSSLIDVLRQKTFEKIWLRFLDNHLDAIELKVMHTSKRLATKVTTNLNKFYGN